MAAYAASRAAAASAMIIMVNGIASCVPGMTEAGLTAKFARALPSSKLVVIEWLPSASFSRYYVGE